MHARLDHHLAVTLRQQPRFDRGEDLRITHGQCFDVERVEIVDVDCRHGSSARRAMLQTAYNVAPPSQPHKQLLASAMKSMKASSMTGSVRSGWRVRGA